MFNFCNIARRGALLPLLALTFLKCCFATKAASLESATNACVGLISSAESRFHIPSGLLLAIALVESGRPDARTGQLSPWPWALNVGGTARFPLSRQDAAIDVAAAETQGVTSIDVGCMQINLQQHPAAFGSVDEALDPASNVTYAAAFLTTLYRQTRDWPTAIGYYHSHTASFAEPYRSRVESLLSPRRFTTAVLSERDILLHKLKDSWASTLPASAAPAAGSWEAWATSRSRPGSAEPARQVASR